MGFRDVLNLAAPRISPDHNHSGLAPAKPVSPGVAKLQARARELANEAERKSEAAEAAVAAAQELQHRLATLQKTADESADAVIVGDSQCASFMSSITMIENSMLTNSWAQKNGYSETVSVPLNDYTTLRALRDAVEDFTKRIRPGLKLRAAQAASDLEAFERKHL